MLYYQKFTDQIIDLALAEDFYDSDVTSMAFSDSQVTAEIYIKESGVLCGIDVLEKVFQKVDKNLGIFLHKKDRENITGKTFVATIKGSEKAVLSGERTALNFLSHLSGIATLTAKFVEKLGDKNIYVRDTRKTIPGLRYLEKYAVEIGGGKSQRMHLADEILFKDNHWVSLEKEGISLGEYLEKTKKLWVGAGLVAAQNGRPQGSLLRHSLDIPIQIEVETEKQLDQALQINPDLILLDNTGVEDIAKRAKKIRNFSDKIKIEVSGNVTLENIDQYRGLDIDYISSGALTNSAKSLNVGLDIV